MRVCACVSPACIVLRALCIHSIAGVKSEFKQLAVCVSFGIVIFSLLRLILGDSRLTDQIGTTTSTHFVLTMPQNPA